MNYLKLYPAVYSKCQDTYSLIKLLGENRKTPMIDFTLELGIYGTVGRIDEYDSYFPNILYFIIYDRKEQEIGTVVWSERKKGYYVADSFKYE